MKKYEVIFFDADDTLFDFKKAERFALEKSIREINVEYIESYHLPTYSKINKGVWAEFEQGLLAADNLKTERFKRLFEAINVNANPHEFSEIYLKSLAEASFLMQEALDVVKYLEKKYRLLILTNGFSIVQNKRIGQSRIAQYIDEVVISEEVNSAKPERKIFQIAMERAQHQDKGTVLMVGDSLSSDIQGGINFEIDTCWFNPQRLPVDPKIMANYEIHSLTELKNLL